MFSLSTIIAMNARADRKRKRDRERAAAKRADRKRKTAEATNRSIQDNDQ